MSCDGGEISDWTDLEEQGTGTCEMFIGSRYVYTLYVIAMVYYGIQIVRFGKDVNQISRKWYDERDINSGIRRRERLKWIIRKRSALNGKTCVRKIDVRNCVPYLDLRRTKFLRSPLPAVAFEPFAKFDLRRFPCQWLTRQGTRNIDKDIYAGVS